MGVDRTSGLGMAYVSDADLNLTFDRLDAAWVAKKNSAALAFRVPDLSQTPVLGLPYATDRAWNETLNVIDGLIATTQVVAANRMIRPTVNAIVNANLGKIVAAMYGLGWGPPVLTPFGDVN